MKKYVKPELFCESFELAQHIAACDFDSNGTHDGIEDCRFTGIWEGYDGNMNEITVFAVGNCAEQINKYCYHNGSGGAANLFNS